MGVALFPTDVPELEWAEFSAEGFSEPVCGVVYRDDRPPCCGVPLGGIGTGCLDLDASGVIGFSTIFNSYIPRRNPRFLPLMGLSVGGETWLLATERILRGGTLHGCTRPRAARQIEDAVGEDWSVQVPPIDGVGCARRIHYWGHYPVADLEYETDAPVSVGLRAWSPFIPGYAGSSSVPGAVFEIHLRNASDARRQGTFAFFFPGPTEEEAGAKKFQAEDVEEELQGVHVTAAGGVGYFLGVIGREKLRVGGSLGADGAAWAKIAADLPARTPEDAGASLAVDFDLEPSQEKTVRILLAWYAPEWQGERGNRYSPIYILRYRDSLEVARRLTGEHTSLLKRILSWQQAVYAEPGIPGWLAGGLVNSLCLMTEDSIWALPRPPLGDWGFPGGVYGQYESPRSCHNIECLPCSWYAHLPLNYFFPELARSALRGFASHMREDGAPPFRLGGAMDLDVSSPIYDYQAPLNAVCIAAMVDRLWQSTGDDTVLNEFYPAVKKSTIWSMNQVAGPDGVISVPDEDDWPKEWFEHMGWYGMCAHAGGLRLSSLNTAERMAEKMGDTEFADQCRRWFEQGSKAMEEKMWNEQTQSYLLYNSPATGKVSDDIMSNQLDAEWENRLHGLGRVFRADRVEEVLSTIERTCLVDIGGAVGFAKADGTPQLTSYGIFSAQTHLLAMTFMYEGRRETGLKILQQCMYNLVIRHRYAWDLPNMIRCDTGERTFGTDYNQNMMLWGAPAALAGQDISAFCGPTGMVRRMVEAGRKLGEGIRTTAGSEEDAKELDIFLATLPADQEGDAAEA